MYRILETTLIPPATIGGCCLYCSLFLMYIGIIAELSLDIANLCFLHQSCIVLSVFWNVVRISGMGGPCIMIIMSLAKTTICEFGTLASSAVR